MNRRDFFKGALVAGLAAFGLSKVKRTEPAGKVLSVSGPSKQLDFTFDSLYPGNPLADYTISMDTATSSDYTVCEYWVNGGPSERIYINGHG